MFPLVFFFSFRKLDNYKLHVPRMRFFSVVHVLYIMQYIHCHTVSVPADLIFNFANFLSTHGPGSRKCLEYSQGGKKQQLGTV